MLMMQHERAQWQRPQPKYKYIDTLTETARKKLFASARKMDAINAAVAERGDYTQEEKREYCAARSEFDGMEFYQIEAVKKAARNEQH